MNYYKLRYKNNAEPNFVGSWKKESNVLGQHSYIKNTVQFIDRALQKKKMEATKVKVLYQEKFQI